MTVRSEVRPGAYYDSIVLMQLQSALLDLPEVEDAGVVMGSEANLAVLEANGLLSDAVRGAGPTDLLIVVRAANAEAGEAALGQVDALLSRRRSSGGEAAEGFRPRSLATAFKALPEARWVAVSVPGRYAVGVAEEALAAGRHVFLYSDNVPLADEVRLKAMAWEKGLLVMGPDCGTAIVNGVGFGFANRVRQGNVGLVGASGTGLQALTVRLHELGAGISHAIGTGGRDLSAEVGAVTAHQGLDLLGRDAGTRVVVLVAKPPAPAVACRLLAAARACGKPVVVLFLGYAPPCERLGNLCFATSFATAARLAAALAADEMGEEPAGGEEAQETFTLPDDCYLRGLFAGGTLAYEAQQALRAFYAPLYADSPLAGVELLADPSTSQAHTVLDLGADAFTVGRLHPMIDQDLRLRRLRQEAADPQVGLILLDVVLGEGAHADPAAELAPVIAAVKADAAAAGRSLEILVLVLGTDDDPQQPAEQAARLAAAGARVFRSSDAFLAAACAASPPRSESGVRVDPAVLGAAMAVVNVGVESFGDSFERQGATTVQVEWRPPAGGDAKLQGILARLKGS